MAKVEINGLREGNKHTVTLHNGDLVIVDLPNDLCEIFLVTSYTSYGWEKTSGDLTKRPEDYCALVSIETGAKMFPEPCSRRTDRKRILSHLCNRYKGLNDGMFQVIAFNDYCLSINLKEGYTPK